MLDFNQKKPLTAYEKGDKKVKSNEINKQIAQAVNKVIPTDYVSNEIEEKIKYVIEINPFQNRTLDIVRYRASSGTFYTAPTDKDFYITNAWISCDGAAEAGGFNWITYTDIDGTVIKLLACTVSGNDNTNNSISVQFPKNGIKVKQGTTIDLDDGGFETQAGIVGYTIDTRIYTQNGD